MVPFDVWNFSTLSIDVLLTLLCNFAHNSPICINSLSNVVGHLKLIVTLPRTLNRVQLSPLMLWNCSTLFIDVLLTLLCNFPHNSPIGIHRLSNVVRHLKLNVKLLRTLNRVQWFTLTILNCSTLSIYVLFTLLCNFTHNFAYSHP